MKDPIMFDFTKPAESDGEPAAKRYCKPPGSTPENTTFSGTNDNDGQVKGKKRSAPQDNLSAIVFVYRPFK
ncbi:unnamed protein product [Caenorhabditis sp. 36 PRJEB53466]|nr:unnamed protein product [Caenorhabditis sp. 36 PRJEB53466]